jgi:nitroreductase
MELLEAVGRRRMVRNYSDLPVEREALQRIVELARHAPSAGFTQGQSFVVVTDQGTRQAIANLAGEDEYVAKGFDPWISRAPAHLVVCVSEAAYHRRYQEPDKRRSGDPEMEWPIPYWWVDAGAALMLVLLAAVEEGLAAGFLGVDPPALQELLGIPPEAIPIGVVTIGHPAPDRRSGSLDRGRRLDQVHWEKWGA